MDTRSAPLEIADDVRRVDLYVGIFALLVFYYPVPPTSDVNDVCLYLRPFNLDKAPHGHVAHGRFLPEDII